MGKKVSVIVSNYYNGKYILEAVSSIFKQTYSNYEVIVVDDTNGNDGIRDYLNAYINHSDIFPIFLYKTNDIGLSALRNFGANKARGKYLLFLDADDKLHPSFLEKTVLLLEKNDDFHVIFSDTQHFDGADTCWIQPEYHFKSLLSGNYICSCSLIRRSSLEAVGGFDEDNFNYWEDYEFWIAMGAKGFYGKHIPEKLFYYRISKNSGMQSKRNIFLAYFYKAYIITKFPQLYSKEIYLSAKMIVSEYPHNFIKLKPPLQEKYLKSKGLIK